MEFFKSHWFLILMLTLASAFVFVWLFVFNREKLKAKWWEILIVTVIHTGYGVLTVKFFALLEAGFNFEKAGNMSLFGGIFFMPLMYFCYAKIKKIPVSIVFDIFVVCLAATLALARINCLYAGCCIGKYISGDSGPRWPTREIDVVTHALFVIFAIVTIKKEKLNSKLYPLYLIAYGVMRFVIEWFRDSTGSALFHVGHIWSIVSTILGFIIFLIMMLKERKNELGANDEKR